MFTVGREAQIGLKVEKVEKVEKFQPGCSSLLFTEKNDEKVRPSHIADGVFW